MNLKSLRQILKTSADDTRLRIMNILYDNELNVKDICKILRIGQSTVSKHLSRLRLLKMVTDKRVGNLVYYSNNNKIPESLQNKVTSFIISQFADIETFKKDKEEARKLKEK